MNPLWAVPVVAVAVGVAVVLSRLRALEDLSVELARSVRRTAELRPPIAAVRRELRRSGPIADRLRAHWSDDEGPGGDPPPGPPPGPSAPR